MKKKVKVTRDGSDLVTENGRIVKLKFIFLGRNSNIWEFIPIFAPKRCALWQQKMKIQYHSWRFIQER